MGKHTKLKPPRKTPAKGRRRKGPAAKGQRGKGSSAQSTKHQPLELPTPHEEADALLRDELEHLRSLRQTVADALASGKATPALVRESAGVARALVSVSTEIRQRDKYARSTVPKMTPEERDELVLSYIRDLPKERRAVIRELLDELDSEDLGVLG